VGEGWYEGWLAEGVEGWPVLERLQDGWDEEEREEARS